jgi:hypothetical protein
MATALRPRFSFAPHALACLTLAALAGAPAAGAQLSVVGQTVQERAAAPGRSYTGTVLVSNASREPQTARLYLTDYWFDAAGETRYDAPGTLARSSAAWVALDAGQVRVAPGATVPVRYTVRVPAGAPLAGTYWSMLMIESATPAPAAGGGVAFGTAVRYGVQLVSHVDGAREAAADTAAAAPPAAPSAEISAPRVVSGEHGARVLTFDLRHTGTRGYRPTLSVELVDESGRSHGTLRQTRGLLYPGTSLRQRFVLDGVPAGRYTAVVVADTGDEVYAVQVAVGV